MKVVLSAVCFLVLSSGLSAAQPTEEAWRILDAGLSSGNPEVRKQALVGTGAIGNTPETVRIEVNSLHNDKDPEVRQMAAAQLGMMKATSAAHELEVALDDPDPQVAFTAAKALWEMGNRRSKGELQDVLTGQRHNGESFITKNERDAKKIMHDPKEMAMLGAREASGALLGPFSIGVTAAEGFLKDTGAPGRAAAAGMLAQDCDARAFQLLDWALSNDHNWAVKGAVAKAIGQCGHAEEIPKLESYFDDGHAALRFMAAGAVIRLSNLTPAAETAHYTAAAAPAESTTQELQQALAPNAAQGTSKP